MVSSFPPCGRPVTTCCSDMTVAAEPLNRVTMGSKFPLLATQATLSGCLNSEKLAFTQARFLLWEKRIIIANVF